MNEILKNRKAILTEMGHILTERQRQVLEQRWGLVDGYARTIEEVSRQCKTTAVRIKEIEARALARISKYLSLREKEDIANFARGRNDEHGGGDSLRTVGGNFGIVVDEKTDGGALC